MDKMFDSGWWHGWDCVNYSVRNTRVSYKQIDMTVAIWFGTVDLRTKDAFQQNFMTGMLRGIQAAQNHLKSRLDIASGRY